MLINRQALKKAMFFFKVFTKVIEELKIFKVLVKLYLKSELIMTNQVGRAFSN